jgi:hypothetical protein
MPGRRILSEAQLDEMTDLREGGATLAAIARHFTAAGTPITATTIAWQCLRLGVVPPNYTPASLGRGCGGQGRPYLPEDDERLLALEREGLSKREIARQMGRNRSSIAARLYTLARRDALQEECAARPATTKQERARASLTRHRLTRQIEAARAKLRRLEALAERMAA